MAVLERSRELGLLGPGDPGEHRLHALSFSEAWERLDPAPPRSFCDLGAGGGVPGLVLADRWRGGATVVLLDSSARRCAFLREAVAMLELGGVRVAEGRAEDLARSAELEAAFDLVTARSFGPPAVTAECAARLLNPLGSLLVSEPPAASSTAERWPAQGLALLGLGPATVLEAPRRLVRIARVGPCPPRFPRRTGVPSKRPLF